MSIEKIGTAIWSDEKSARDAGGGHHGKRRRSLGERREECDRRRGWPPWKEEAEPWRATSRVRQAAGGHLRMKRCILVERGVVVEPCAVMTHCEDVSLTCHDNGGLLTAQ